MLVVLIALSAMLVTSTSCGYGTAGKAVRIPANIQSIAIPIFVNQTQTYRIEQTMTAAVVREFISRTKYRVLHDTPVYGGASTTASTNNAAPNSGPSPDADATLRGTVVSTQLAPLTYDSQTGRASSALITVNLKIVLTDRNGKVLYDNPNYVFREQYQVSREISSFFEEESPAVERLSRDMARTLVADILENY